EFSPCGHDRERMARCQREDLIAPAGEKNIAVDEQRPSLLPRKGREHCLETAFNNCASNENLHSDCATSVLQSCRVTRRIRVVRVDQHGDGFGCRYQIMQEPELLRL